MANQRWALGRVVSRTSTSTVYKATRRGIKPCTDVAIKKVIDGRRDVSREYSTWKTCNDHDNVVRLVDMFTDSDDRRSCFVSEFCRHGTLEHTVSDVDDRVGIVRDVLCAIHHCHSNGVAHCDINPSNILRGDDMKWKVCDFGDARANPLFMHCTDVYAANFIGIYDASKPVRVIGYRGSSGMYTAPEMLAGEAFGYNVDMWALGILAFQVFGGGNFRSHPFLNDVEHTLLSRHQMDFVSRCVNIDKMTRLTSARALTHPLFTCSNSNRSW